MFFEPCERMDNGKYGENVYTQRLAKHSSSFICRRGKFERENSCKEVVRPTRTPTSSSSFKGCNSWDERSEAAWRRRLSDACRAFPGCARRSAPGRTLPATPS